RRAPSAVGRELGLHLAQAGQRHGRARRPLHRDSRRRHPRVRDALAVSRVLVVNPFATGVTEARLAAVRSALPSATVVRVTTRRGQATDIAREVAATVAAVYVYGGDGTFNEVLNGIDGRTPLGFIPGGGTSVLPRALGLPRDPVAAAQRVAAGVERRISLGRVNGHRFGFGAGVGLDAGT